MKRRNILFSALLITFTLLFSTGGCAQVKETRQNYEGIWAAHDLRPMAVTVHGHKLVYVKKGSGPAIVMIHGFGSNLAAWSHQIDVLAPHLTVYSIDLIGHGLSDKPDIAYTPRDFLDHVSGWMDAVGLKSATFMGCSMGGGISIGMAIDYPQRVERLILVDALPPQRFKRKTVLENEEVKKSVEAVSPAVQEPLAVPDEMPATPVRFMNRMNRNFGLWGGYADKVPAIRQPTLIIWGENDPAIPLKFGRILHDEIPGAKLVIIPDGRHTPMKHKPDETNRAIMEFLGLGGF